ncbi:MAG: D-glycerate dehydrogenase [Planctomycetes bacterium]|nr:D-glycerate dehydrogenase [Planctomycetota bacterium]
MPRIVITRAVPESTLTHLQEALPNAELWVNPDPANLSNEELIAHAKGADALLCTLADKLDSATLDAIAGNLKVIATYAVGTNNIDLAHASFLNIAVANTPDVLTDASAEIAIALILATARRVVEGDQMVRQDRFTGWAPLLHLGHGVFGKTIGIVGAGRIGQRVGRSMALGFDCKVLYTSRNDKADFEAACGARRVPLEELLAESDVVSLHCPLTEDTYYLLNTARIELMKPNAILVNTARGPVVDEEALVDALKRGVIAGAGLDVYEDEPALKPGLASLPNVVLLPHIGSATYEAREAMGQLCANAFIDVLAGKAPSNLANEWRSGA